MGLLDGVGWGRRSPEGAISSQRTSRSCPKGRRRERSESPRRFRREPIHLPLAFDPSADLETADRIACVCDPLLENRQPPAPRLRAGALRQICDKPRRLSPTARVSAPNIGGVLQSVDRQHVGEVGWLCIVCNQEVTGSIPVRSIDLAKRVGVSWDARAAKFVGNRSGRIIPRFLRSRQDRRSSWDQPEESMTSLSSQEKALHFGERRRRRLGTSDDPRPRHKAGERDEGVYDLPHREVCRAIAERHDGPRKP
jgi:hypothetical protein